MEASIETIFENAQTRIRTRAPRVNCKRLTPIDDRCFIFNPIHIGSCTLGILFFSLFNRIDGNRVFHFYRGDSGDGESCLEH